MALQLLLLLILWAPQEDKKLSLELFWAEKTPVPKLTQATGTEVSCSDKPVFLHLKPVLTLQDFVKVTSQQNNNSSTYLLTFDLTKTAKETWKTSNENNLNKVLVTKWNGNIVAAMVMASKVEVIPVLGSFSQDQLDELNKAIKK